MHSLLLQSVDTQLNHKVGGLRTPFFFFTNVKFFVLILMNGKLDPEDRVLDWFEQTCDKPYDRHQYQLIYSNKKIKVFDTWEEARSEWWNTPTQFTSHIEVLDRKKSNKKSNGGFK